MSNDFDFELKYTGPDAPNSDLCMALEWFLVMIRTF